MKARKVKGLDPASAVADNAERIVLTRLEELYSFMPRAADPTEVQALHEMRIAAKRLRYVLEVMHPCLGAFARDALKPIKALQDLAGEVHDCDVQLPAVMELLDAQLRADATLLAGAAAADSAEDLDPALLAQAPHLDAYAGLAAYALHLRARRRLLYGHFRMLWNQLQQDGFHDRLQAAARERPAGTIGT